MVFLWFPYYYQRIHIPLLRVLGRLHELEDAKDVVAEIGHDVSEEADFWPVGPKWPGSCHFCGKCHGKSWRIIIFV